MEFQASLPNSTMAAISNPIAAISAQAGNVMAASAAPKAGIAVPPNHNHSGADHDTIAIQPAHIPCNVVITPSSHSETKTYLNSTSHFLFIIYSPKVTKLKIKFKFYENIFVDKLFIVI